MKIKDETKPPITFCELAPGDCFRVPGSGYHYLKMEPVYDDDGCEIRCNAVYLEDGEPTEFVDNAEVILIEAEFVIK